MRKISGDLVMMSLPDIMQWAETNRKTGTLALRNEGVSKSFYFQEGTLIFVSSQKEGERLGEYFTANNHLDEHRLARALKESRMLGVPFTGYLISENLIDRDTLQRALERLVEITFTDALTWEEGTFEFTDSLPSIILNGPVKLKTSFVVFQAVKTFDESRKGESPDTGDILVRLEKCISGGSIDLPPVPDIMIKLEEAMRKEDTSVHEIVRIIMSDQILTSKILRVVNSAFYSSSREITSLQQAIILMGLKSILSIVTVHTISGFTTKNADAVREILRHSLLCAFVARKLATALGADPEEAFVCALLHDIGKTVILNFLAQQTVPDEIKERIITGYHDEVGFALASKWNLSEVIRLTIKFHHEPQSASAGRETVETVHLADLIAHGREIPQALAERLNGTVSGRIDTVLSDLDGIRDVVASVI